MFLFVLHMDCLQKVTFMIMVRQGLSKVDFTLRISNFNHR